MRSDISLCIAIVWNFRRTDELRTREASRLLWRPGSNRLARGAALARDDRPRGRRPARLWPAWTPWLRRSPRTPWWPQAAWRCQSRDSRAARRGVAERLRDHAGDRG